MSPTGANLTGSDFGGKGPVKGLHPLTPEGTIHQ
jgi:hypothetical protein